MPGKKIQTGIYECTSVRPKVTEYRLVFLHVLMYVFVFVYVIVDLSVCVCVC